MASDIAFRRLTKELAALAKDPIKSPVIAVAPNERNLLEMHYVIEGCEGTPYEGGVYHGVLLFPKQYPLKPPSVLMKTPSGRFQPNRRLCLSMSDFHPETWNPMWSVSTILTGLYSFMMEVNSPTLGSIETSTRTKRQLAASSLEWNMTKSHDAQQFRQLFPQYIERFEKEQEEKVKMGSTTTSAVSSSDETWMVVGMPVVFATTAGLVALVSIIIAAMRFV